RTSHDSHPARVLVEVRSHNCPYPKLNAAGGNAKKAEDRLAFLPVLWGKVSPADGRDVTDPQAAPAASPAGPGPPCPPADCRLGRTPRGCRPWSTGATRSAPRTCPRTGSARGVAAPPVTEGPAPSATCSRR